MYYNNNFFYKYFHKNTFLNTSTYPLEHLFYYLSVRVKQLHHVR